MNVICNYCSKPARLVLGRFVYPMRADLKNKLFYLCRDCNAFVGCYPNTKVPMGTLANENLRNIRKSTHEVFDVIWKSKLKFRTEAYRWLSEKLNIPFEKTHIGMFDEETCRKVVEFTKEFLKV